MQIVRTFEEANLALAEFVPNVRSAGQYTLDRMRQLMDVLDNPQNRLQVIHVAGTSGKTSTCYYLSALLQATGKKVGLTVSPHVDEVNERVQINLIPMPEQEFCQELSEFLRIIEANRIDPSYFELMIAFVYWEFVRQKVDYAIIEVGLGGLLDGTNVVDGPDKVCVITDIGLDHIDRLGNTLTEIAEQKAGIIGHGNITFCNKQDEAILTVFRQQCKERSATLHVLRPTPLNDGFDFLPLFQQRNFSLAQAVVDYMIQRDQLASLDHSQKILAAHTLVPARMEIFKYQDKTIILDGAHNAQKLTALITSIQAQFPGQSVAALVSFADGRSYRLQGSIDALRSLVSSVIVTAFHGGQDLPHGPIEPGALAALFRQQGYDEVSIVQAPEEGLYTLLKQPKSILLVTGSFFLMDDVRQLVRSLAKS